MCVGSRKDFFILVLQRKYNGCISVAVIKEKALLALQDKLTEEHQADLAAIKRVLKLLRKKGINPEGTRTKKAPSEPVGASQNGDGAEQRIITTINNMPGRFTLADLMAAAQKAYPEAMINRNTVSGVLFRYKDKRVRVVEEGRGRRAAIYEGIV